MTATLTAGAPAPPAVRTGAAAAALSGAATALVGMLGVCIGLAGLTGRTQPVAVDWLLPLSGVRFDVDGLGGFFTALTGVVAIPVGIYGVGYARREGLGVPALAVLPVFVAAMLMVPTAGSISTFVLGWELMALTSVVLVLSDHRRPEVRSAALFYAVLTQLGFVAILIALMIAASHTGGALTDLTGLADGPRLAVFLLTVAGFGSKAGLVPLHAWMPKAYAEAPSPVSALMSATTVNLGIYGIIRFDLQLLGSPQRWWGLLLITVGAGSALYGVLQASVATDLKRLLAYSSTENMGLVTLALGAGVLLTDVGAGAAAVVAYTGAALHLIAHTAFKCLGFLAAGVVQAGTGLTDLDRLGGLARRMPATTTLFGIAALGASGLPIGAGFVSEWLLLQALIHGGTGHGTAAALVAPLAVGAIALTTGLGVAAMVKAFGIGFLARARSRAAEQAIEATPTMVAGMVVAAISCIVIAIAPAVLAPAVQQAVMAITGTAPESVVDFGAVIRLPGLGGTIGPGLLAGALVLAMVAAVIGGQWRSQRRPAPERLPLWACGAAELTPRMQYTATSFAEPLQRVFDDVLAPDTDVEVSHTAESRYMVESISYRSRIADVVEVRLYRPVVRAVEMLAGLVRRAHTGSVHLYLAVGGLGILIMLVVAR